VSDGQAVYRSIDRRLDTSPNTIAAVRYDLCRTDGTCSSHTITRPAAPVPPGALQRPPLSLQTAREDDRRQW